MNGHQVLLHSPLTHSLTAALDQLREVASSTSNDPGPRSRQHQQIGQFLLPIAAANFSVDDPTVHTHTYIHYVSKSVPGLTSYSFNTHPPVFVIFGMSSADIQK